MCGLLLRIGQCASAAASIGVMVSATDFSGRTAFWYAFFFLSVDLVLSDFGLFF